MSALRVSAFGFVAPIWFFFQRSELLSTCSQICLFMCVSVVCFQVPY